MSLAICPLSKNKGVVKCCHSIVTRCCKVKVHIVSVCTTTIWIGHLNKFTSEDELKTELERYGPVENINVCN